MAASWRNAACLMFLTGPFKYTKQPMKFTQPVTIGRSPFIQYKSPGSAEQPEMLFVQRHSKSGFMANTHVFPGGVLDEADYSPGWLRLFTEPSGCSHPFSSITSLKPRSLPVYDTCPHNGPIAGEVAFRICAIREFFEEAGILLARDRDKMASVVDVVPGTCSPALKELSQAEMREWREKVHNNAHEFITMCRELDCVPDIWSLVEWSDWLTPRNHKRRYDTLFFMCYSESKPEASPDLIEVTKTQWITPSAASGLFRSGKVMFAPPQFAEISYLERIAQIPLMHLLALHKSIMKDGMLRRGSVRILTKDAIVSVANQDDLFPLEGPEDRTTPIQHPQSAELQRCGVSLILSQNPQYEFQIPTHSTQELRDLSRTTNRIEFRSRVDYNAVSSVDAELMQVFLQQMSEPAGKL